MTMITKEQWIGIPAEEPVKQTLRAGKLTAVFENGRLCSIKAGNETVLDEIYYALRDRNWGTIPYKISDLSVQQDEDAFHLTFRGEHHAASIDYRFEASIVGTADSSITYSFTGTSESSFLSNRIGFCVLHPASCAGGKCIVRHGDDSEESGFFPEQIAPHQPYFDISAISHFLPSGSLVKTEFEGDIFEMEDQRNWTDASYKTYCTPLAKPFPVQVLPGDSVQQSVRISLLSTGEASAAAWEEKKSPAAGAACGLFSLGVEFDAPLTDYQEALVRELQLGHILADYHVGSREDEAKLTAATELAKKCSVRLRARVFMEDASQLPAAYNVLSAVSDQIKDITVLHGGAAVLSDELLGKAKSCFAPLGVAVGSGTNGFFTQLNRNRIPGELVDFLSYSNNPQVHAFDNESIMNTVAGQLANIHSCRSLYPDKPIWLTPVTMRIRWNPDATGAQIRSPGQLPVDVEPRQMSLFAASWFVKSIAACVEAGIAGATCFAFTGAKGIMEEGSPDRDYPFPSQPGMLYPLFFAFYGMRGLENSQVRCFCSETHSIIALQDGTHRRLILANHTDRAIQCTLPESPDTARVLTVDENTIEALSQLRDLTALRSRFIEQSVSKTMWLERYAVVLIEL